MIKADRKYVRHDAKIVSIKRTEHIIPRFQVRYCVDTKRGLIYADKHFWVLDELQAYVEFEKLRMGKNGEIPNEKET